MSSSLKSLIDCGTKLWLDSVDPELVVANRELGATGATSNPIIIADLIKSQKFDADMAALFAANPDNEAVTWQLTDQIVRQAGEVFLPVFQQSKGNDGYVSFELDPLLEDSACQLSVDEKAKKYVSLAQHWGKDNPNRLIKVPATPGGLAALEDMVAAGINVNVTLIFSDQQYQTARDNVWRGAKRRGNLDSFKSVYSIFVSRLDVYTEKHAPKLTVGQGYVGIVNAKRIWQANQDFWQQNQTPLQQEIVFASTGTKKPEDPAWKYVEAFAGSDIETNPPKTNEAYAQSGRSATRQIDRLPEPAIVDDIDQHVDFQHLEVTLMKEGLAKFAEPQKALLSLIASKRPS